MAQVGGGVDDVLDLLVRHQPAHDRDRGSGRGAPGRHVRLRRAVVHHRDPRLRDAEVHELLARGHRHGDVLAAPVDPRREPALDPPADAARHAGVHDRPLLLVHVVHQHDDRRPGGQPREERHAVLDVHDDVRPAELAAPQRTETRGVDAQLAAPVDVADPGDRLLGRRPRVAGAEHRHGRPPRHEPLGDLLEVQLGAAPLGVAAVAPAEEDDVPPLQRRPRSGQRLLGHRDTVEQPLPPAGARLARCRPRPLAVGRGVPICGDR